MRAYHSLSEAMRTTFYRKPREVIVIVSFNGQAYFVQRSTPTPEIEILKQAQIRISIGKELANRFGQITTQEATRKSQLLKFMNDAGIPQLFNKASRHAEENLILRFPEMLKEFEAMHPNQKIKTIDVFLTHSPCSEEGERDHSSQCSLNGFFAPAGCDKKLDAFFKKNYMSTDKSLFNDTPKIRVRYYHKFNSSISYPNDGFIKEVDPLLGAALKADKKMVL